MTESYLREKYEIQQCSLPDIARELGLDSVTAVWRQLRKLGIVVRPVGESRKLDKAKLKAQKTCQESYGCRHPFCKESPVRQSWQRRLLDEEGIVNVFQREDVKKKARVTFRERYRVESPGELPRRGRSNYSKAHKKVVEYLISTGRSPMIEYKLPTGDDGSYRSFDIWLAPDMFIEVHGGYWHADPHLYAPDSIIKISKAVSISAASLWERDYKKCLLANKNGFRVLTLWESDIKTRWNVVVDRIENYLKGGSDGLPAHSEFTC